MDFIAAFFKLVDQYGLRDGVIVVVVLVGVFILWRLSNTRNRIALSNAEGRNRTEKAEAESTISLSQSIREMADSNNAILKATIEWMKNAESDRAKQFSVLTDVLGQLRGLSLAQGDEAKRARTMSATLDEVADRITPMQTDLKDVSLRTAGLQSAFTSVVDERVAPLLTLLIGMNTQLNALAQLAQTGSQNVDAIFAEVVKVHAITEKVVIEFKLLKDLIFDRDDRIANILTTYTAKETTP